MTNDQSSSAATSDRLQCDLLTPDRKTLSMEKAMLVMWENRNNFAIVEDIMDIIW